MKKLKTKLLIISMFFLGAAVYADTLGTLPQQIKCTISNNESSCTALDGSNLKYFVSSDVTPRETTGVYTFEYAIANDDYSAMDPQYTYIMQGDPSKHIELYSPYLDIKPAINAPGMAWYLENNSYSCKNDISQCAYTDMPFMKAEK